MYSVLLLLERKVYSMALMLEESRKRNAGFDYQITGIDIDPISIDTAQKAIYSSDHLSKIPITYHHNVLLGSGKTKGMMTLSKDVRSRCEFREHSALDLISIQEKYDIVLCRNMLIYFDEVRVNDIVRGLPTRPYRTASLFLGHSESFSTRLDAERVGGSIYLKRVIQILDQ